MGAMTLAEASDWLGLHQDTVREMAVAGELPAARVGAAGGRGTWRFLEDDLASWLRSRYVRTEIQSGCGGGGCRSIGEAKSGGSGSPHPPGSGYANLLGLETGAKPKNSKPRSARSSGVSNGLGSARGGPGKKPSSDGPGKLAPSAPTTTTSPT